MLDTPQLVCFLLAAAQLFWSSSTRTTRLDLESRTYPLALRFAKSFFDFDSPGKRRRGEHGSGSEVEWCMLSSHPFRRLPYLLRIKPESEGNLLDNPQHWLQLLSDAGKYKLRVVNVPGGSKWTFDNKAQNNTYPVNIFYACSVPALASPC